MPIRTKSAMAALYCAFLFSSDPAYGQSISSELVVSGLTQPLDLESPPGDSRLFIAEQTGRIRIVDSGVLLPTPYFDGTGIVAAGSYTGLRGLAFHPDYANNGYVYIAYDTVTSGAGDVVIDRLTVSGSDPNVVDPASRVEILRVTQTAAWHGGGDMAFGADGFFYTAYGDGHGLGNDPSCNAQRMSTLLGKMIRIDVDSGFPYTIPADNPFVGVAGAREEIVHLGMRHPWRWSFDRANDDLYIADVGQSGQEEIDFAASGVKGLNFGWKVMEGTDCRSTSGCNSPAPCNDPSYADPILTQPTSLNCSITGGFVYRGQAIPSEQGNYFFGSYCTGAVWSMSYDGSTVSNMTQRNSDFGMNFSSLTSFGQDAFGELYILSRGGSIHKIVPVWPPAVNYSTTNPNSSGLNGMISFAGDTSVSDNDFTLHATGLPFNRFGLFLSSRGQGFVANPGMSQGNLCVGGGAAIGRHNRVGEIVFSGSTGSFSLLLDLNDIPTPLGSSIVVAGETWNFQAWFRDQNPSDTSNFTNGLSAIFH